MKWSCGFNFAPAQNLEVCFKSVCVCVCVCLCVCLCVSCSISLVIRPWALSQEADMTGQ